MLFKDIKCIEDLKAQYRKMAMVFHPDCGGTDEQMKALNLEYESLFGLWKNIHRKMFTDQQGTRRNPTEAESQYYESKTATKEQAGDFIRIVTELLKMKGIEVELCGRWLWIGGETRKYKDNLKALGCRWSPDKKLWSWHFIEDSASPFKTRNFTMTEIRRGYGSTKFTDEERGLLGA